MNCNARFQSAERLGRQSDRKATTHNFFERLRKVFPPGQGQTTLSLEISKVLCLCSFHLRSFTHQAATRDLNQSPCLSELLFVPCARPSGSSQLLRLTSPSHPPARHPLPPPPRPPRASLRCETSFPRLQARRRRSHWRLLQRHQRPTCLRGDTHRTACLQRQTRCSISSLTS